MDDSPAEILFAWPFGTIAGLVVVIAAAGEKEGTGQSAGLALMLDLTVQRASSEDQEAPTTRWPNRMCSKIAELMSGVLDIIADRGAFDDRLVRRPGAEWKAQSEDVRVRADAGIAEQVPGAADPVSRLEDQPALAFAAGLQAVRGIDAGNTGSDDDHVQMIGLRIVARHRLSLAAQAPRSLAEISRKSACGTRKGNALDFDLTERQASFRNRVRDFMDAEVRPRVEDYQRDQKTGDRWKVIEVIEELKPKAREAGLWNLFMPPGQALRQHVDESFAVRGRRSSPTSNMRSAPRRWAGSSGRRRCSTAPRPTPATWKCCTATAPREQKERWLRPLMNGEIRSAFLMTEPAVASSDATNIQCADPPRRRRICHQRPQMVVVRRGRSALQGRDRHGQDRPGRREAPAAVDDPDAAGRAGRHDRARAHRLRL